MTKTEYRVCDESETIPTSELRSLIWQLVKHLGGNIFVTTRGFTPKYFISLGNENPTPLASE